MSKNFRKPASKARQKPEKIHFDHSGKNMTSKAGLIPVIKFLEKIGFDKLFQKTVTHERNDNAVYRLEDGVFLILTGLIGGAFNISKCCLLWSGCSVLQRVSGWLRIPNETTIGRLFKEVGERQVSEMETLVHVMRKRVWENAVRAGTSKISLTKTLWIDVDSSVKTTYGKQQGVSKGYNPHKKGAYSYNPQLAFCTQTKEILQGWLRTGSAYTGNGVVEFIKQLLAQMGSQRILFRGDSGYFVGALLDHLDSLGHGYLIKVKLKNLVPLLSRQSWTPIPGKKGWEQCSFWHNAKGWNASRLLVAVRQEKEIESQSGQMHLIAPVSYDFFCYVTTENYTPWQTHKTYGKRATSETWIEEAKSQLGLANMKTDSFLANAALFQSAILAYNTLRWMAISSGNSQLKKWEPESIRVHLICIAGKLLTGGNQIHIKIPAYHLHPKPWKDWLALA